MLKFDPTINLGTLISALLLFIPIIKLIRHIDRVETKVDEVYDWFKNNTERRFR